MDWRPELPVLLPDGRHGCFTHRRIVCHICGVNYEAVPRGEPPRGPATWPFRGGDLDAEINKNMYAPCTKFAPPQSSDTPRSLFEETQPSFGGRRFLRYTDDYQMLIYCDGACPNNGRAGQPASGGCGFVYGPDDTIKFRLEDKGPTGVPHTPTSNRAELRAVIGALRYREWGDGGYKSVVIATDSEYVVKGATEWAGIWLQNGWLNSSGQPVVNQDLWKLFLHLVQRYLIRRGVRVLFWHIPRTLNQRADAAAKEAATKAPVLEFRKMND